MTNIYMADSISHRGGEKKRMEEDVIKKNIFKARIVQPPVINVLLKTGD